MASVELTRVERDKLVAEIHAIFEARYPAEGEFPSDQEDSRLRARYEVLIEEYAQRLPRRFLSACPYCQALLHRSFDPFGLDGIWWHTNPEVRFEEPEACPHFQVLLGALNLNGRQPSEATFLVKPGPDVPFVVPRLLELPGMKAVLSSLNLSTGHTAYPIAYFSDQHIESVQLHQSWCRQSYWFKDREGNSGWSIANDPFDFELTPYLESNRLFWIDLSAQPAKIRGFQDGPCPLIDLYGERQLQEIGDGEVDFVDLPDGEPIAPFE